jgi:hypothetical protein
MYKYQELITRIILDAHTWPYLGVGESGVNEQNTEEDGTATRIWTRAMRIQYPPIPQVSSHAGSSRSKSGRTKAERETIAVAVGVTVSTATMQPMQELSRV